MYGNFEGFPPYNSALFGLVSHNNPCSMAISLKKNMTDLVVLSGPTFGGDGDSALKEVGSWEYHAPF